MCVLQTIKTRIQKPVEPVQQHKSYSTEIHTNINKDGFLFLLSFVLMMAYKIDKKELANSGWCFLFLSKRNNPAPPSNKYQDRVFKKSFPVIAISHYSTRGQHDVEKKKRSGNTCTSDIKLKAQESF